VPPPGTVQELAKPPEIRSALLRVRVVGRQDHQSTHLDAPKTDSGVEQPIELVLPRAELGRLARQVDLDQGGHPSSFPFRGPLQALENIDRIDRMNDLEQARRMIRLVRLQVPDQVPADRLRQPPRLVACLLDPVLPQIEETGLDHLQNPLRRNRLAHAHERDRARIPARPLRGRRNPSAHLLQPGGDRKMPYFSADLLCVLHAKSRLLKYLCCLRNLSRSSALPKGAGFSRTDFDPSARSSASFNILTARRVSNLRHPGESV
jgi:hypothetical protein